MLCYCNYTNNLETKAYYVASDAGYKPPGYTDTGFYTYKHVIAFFFMSTLFVNVTLCSFLNILLYFLELHKESQLALSLYSLLHIVGMVICWFWVPM